MPRRCHLASMLAAVCALAIAFALGGCGNTLQDKPIPHNILEGLIVNPFPVYWLGGSFHGLAVTEASRDPSGAVSVQYGDCLVGGQGICVAPLKVITSADNGFLPGGQAHLVHTQIRGVPATLASGGRTVLIATGPVVLDVYASTASLARAAASAAVPINEPGAAGDPLPGAAPNSGYGETPLPTQEPRPLRPVS